MRKIVNQQEKASFDAAQHCTDNALHEADAATASFNEIFSH
jgi:hypothetical protein